MIVQVDSYEGDRVILSTTRAEFEEWRLHPTPIHPPSPEAATGAHECVDYCWEPDHTTETGERQRLVHCVMCTDAAMETARRKAAPPAPTRPEREWLIAAVRLALVAYFETMAEAQVAADDVVDALALLGWPQGTERPSPEQASDR
jgi:hypothetical protein